jgi:sugar phosphate isomerase/epimerase
VLIDLAPDIETRVQKVRALGLTSCQLCNWNLALLTPEMAACAQRAFEASGVVISSYWAGWSGPKVWDFLQGPATLGLVPTAYRAQRVQDLIAGAAFAACLGVRQVVTHAGFIPENPGDPLYADLVETLRALADDFAARGQSLLFETGQETPVTLLRVLTDIGRENLGVNLDPANLLMYGKANPVDAVDLLAPYIRDVHAKDGDYPTQPRALGVEKALGHGRVDYPAFLKALAAHGYDGPLTIEREITGEQQTQDILQGKALLESILATF